MIREYFMGCLITNNECNTDECFCICENCIKQLHENVEDINPEFSETVDRHFWELF